MSFNSLAPGPRVGQRWAKAKTVPDHLWRQEKTRGEVGLCVRVLVCVWEASALTGSPLHPSFSPFQCVCVHMCVSPFVVCEPICRRRLQGTETPADWITLDNAIDQGIKVTIEYLQHMEPIQSAA